MNRFPGRRIGCAVLTAAIVATMTCHTELEWGDTTAEELSTLETPLSGNPVVQSRTQNGRTDGPPVAIRTLRPHRRVALVSV